MFREAIAELSEAIRLKPDQATAYNARGYAYLRSSHVKAALADFDKAIQLNPAYANAYHNRAIAKKAAGDAVGAAEDEKRAR
jgi:Flp pilus assembly protein TadD